MSGNYVINIGRQLGSGGKEIGEKLAARLGIDFYDKELINLASEESGLCKEFFEKADEKASQGIIGGLFGERLSASDIFRKLKMYNPAAMRGSNPATFAQVLLAAGVTRKHTKYGNVYLVKPMKAA